ncbi:hypothetical protein F4212_00930 [Candidatus Poribacteria bacterium]|nr:hypothetical protein [Candidatus Poribacteria bacterium]
MSFIKRVLLSLLFLVAIGVSVKAHNIHHAADPDLSFTSNPKVSCNIDGTTFIRNIRTDGVGKVLSDFWAPEPIDPVVKMEAEAHGFGWAYILFYGNIDEEPFGDDVNQRGQKLGTFDTGIGVLLPIGWGLNHEVGGKFKGSFNTDPKVYKWDASGSIKLEPWYYKVRHIGGFIPAGSWEPAGKEHRQTLTASGGGSWTVMKSVASIPNVTFNKTTFKVYETLEVTVEKTDLYYVAMYIDDEYAASGYAGSDGEIVLSKTFDTGDVGNHTVKLLIYSDGGANSTTYSEVISVTDGTSVTPEPETAPESEENDQDGDGDGSTRYYCPWCGEHYDPNNNYLGACSVLGGYHDGIPD